jgi:GDPmannose 4,6-dehydratase
MKKILISGITGQDGSYLAELYLNKGYEVHGIVRRSSTLERKRIDHLFNINNNRFEQNIKLHYGDLNDIGALIRVIAQIQPSVVVNLAAQSHVGVSFEVPIETGHVTGLGALAIFEAVRIVNDKIRIYQAGSSEMFGGMDGRDILNEKSEFNPKSPYAAAKVFAHHSAKVYRESYGMFIANGILFNHESPRRGENFVSRKITLAAARISLGTQSKLKLGNIESRRDWGHAQEYARAIDLIMTSESADDYVVATGKSYSVKQFADLAFSFVGLDYKEYLEIDQNLYRPNEVDELIGDPTKIRQKLGWVHEKELADLVADMMKSDLDALAKQ